MNIQESTPSTNMDSTSTPRSVKHIGNDENFGMSIPALVTLDSPVSTVPSTPSTPSSPGKEQDPHTNQNHLNMTNTDAVSDRIIHLYNMSNQSTNETNLTNTDKNSNIDHVKTEIMTADTSEEEEVPINDTKNLEKEGTNEQKIGSDDDDDDSVVLGPIEFFRKSIVAVTGTAMLGVGAVLVPAPVPLGIPVIIGAVALLNKEFPETVNGVKEDARKKIVEALEKDDAKNDIAVNDETNDNGLSLANSNGKILNNDDRSVQNVPQKITLQSSFDKKSREIKQNLRTKVLPWLKRDDEVVKTKD